MSLLDELGTTDGDDTAGPPPEPVEAAPDGPRPRRPWSTRGLPAGITALLVGGVAGTAVFIAVTARTGRAPSWSRDVLTRAETHTWHNAWLLGAGIAIAVLGLWLILLAVTPGRRHLLPLRPVADGLTAYMTRRTAAALLRHTALRSTGVLDARVRMGRRKAVVRVDYHFRDATELHEELTTNLRERAGALLLGRVPKVDLRLQPASGRR